MNQPKQAFASTHEFASELRGVCRILQAPVVIGGPSVRWAIPVRWAGACHRRVKTAEHGHGVESATPKLRSTGTGRRSRRGCGRNSTYTREHGLWWADKYFQQKATNDQQGRKTYTDYYTSSDSNLGNRGQTYQVWDPKYGGVAVNNLITPPSGTRSQDAWRYQVQATVGQHSAQFTYDSIGRAATVQKLQAATFGVPSTYRYVSTQTTYGTSSDGSWGQAAKIVEDFGGIARTTQNAGYTSWGKANDVINGAGHEFQTAYDPDGKVLSVTQVGVGVIASYVYGTSGIENGQVTRVTDNLTHIRQDISYMQSGNGVGMPSRVTEYRNSSSADNIVTYSYGPFGNRSTASYQDGNGNVLANWGYYNYHSPRHLLYAIWHWDWHISGRSLQVCSGKSYRFNLRDSRRSQRWILIGGYALNQ